MQSELNNFIKIVPLPYISKQVFSAARKKLLPTAYVELNNNLVSEFYNDNQFKTFLGFRLVVVDGSTLQLPESSSIRKKYGACSSQKKSDYMSMSRISYAYDPFSGLTLHAIMNPYVAAERDMAFDHILKIPASNCANDLYLFDRGYPSILLIFFLKNNMKDFVMRCSTGWLAEVQSLLKKGEKDAIIEISPGVLKGRKREGFKKIFPDVSLKSCIKIRVIIVDLPTGEKEILITSLLDKVEFKYEIFKGLYHLRWGGEENYKFHKVRIEIENFSGKSTHAIEQDFHATIFTANIRALVASEAEDELEQICPKRQLKYDYKINNNISAGILKNKIVEALLNPEICLKAFCDHLKRDMKRSTIPIRPGRKCERIRKSNRKYHMNMRRAL